MTKEKSQRWPLAKRIITPDTPPPSAPYKRRSDECCSQYADKFCDCCECVGCDGVDFICSTPTNEDYFPKFETEDRFTQDLLSYLRDYGSLLENPIGGEEELHRDLVQALDHSDFKFGSNLPQNSFIVEVRHKPRGSKGTWMPILRGQRIRVDKRKGKLMELNIKFPVTHDLNQDPDFFPRTNIRIFLDDGTQNISPSSSSFHNDLPPSVTTKSTQELFSEIQLGPTTIASLTREEKGLGCFFVQVQIRVRISTISRKQSFIVSMNNFISNSSPLCYAQSIEFSSDDNGRPHDPLLSTTSHKRKRTTFCIEMKDSEDSQVY